MLRWLKQRQQPIHLSQPIDLLDSSRLIHWLIGLDVPKTSSFLDEEDVSKYTTVHQAVLTSYITKPMKTIKIEKRERTA